MNAPPPPHTHALTHTHTHTHTHTLTYTHTRTHSDGVASVPVRGALLSTREDPRLLH